MSKLNLDQLAAMYAQNIVNQTKEKDSKLIDTLERLITKTLGVLQEQGVYAAVLFLYSRTGDETKVAPTIRNQFFRLLQDKESSYEIPAFKGKTVPLNDADAKTALFFFTEEVCNNLSTLFLVKDLYEQTLIYARYGAKAAKEK
jgi:hypothetical protein